MCLQRLLKDQRMKFHNHQRETMKDGMISKKYKFIVLTQFQKKLYKKFHIRKQRQYIKQQLRNDAS